MRPSRQTLVRYSLGRSPRRTAPASFRFRCAWRSRQTVAATECRHASARVAQFERERPGTEKWIPLLEKEGEAAPSIKCREATFKGADGVVAYTPCFKTHTAT